VLSPESVLVMGRFAWGRGDSLEALNFSYSGVLTRQDGELRIRMEDESMDFRAARATICASNP